jgi:two-component system response regulator QseB
VRLLVIEDDPLLGDALAAGLRQLGHVVDWFTDGGGAMQHWRVRPTTP